MENLVGYAKPDLMVPAEPRRRRTSTRRTLQRGRVVRRGQRTVHSEICAVPAERLEHRGGAARGAAVAAARRIGRRRRAAQGRQAVLRPVRLGPLLGPDPPLGANVEVIVIDGRVRSRSSTATGEIVADHPLVAPGEAARRRPLRRRPARQAGPHGAARHRRRRRRSAPSGRSPRRSCRAPPRPGSPDWPSSSTSSPASNAAHGPEPLVAALERAVTFGRWRADDVRSILAAGTGAAPDPTAPGEALVIPLPIVRPGRCRPTPSRPAVTAHEPRHRRRWPPISTPGCAG